MNVRGLKSHVHMAYKQKTAGTGTWIHVRGPTATCTGPIHRKRPAQARGYTSGGVQPRAQGLHTENRHKRHVESRPGTYSHVYRAYTPKTPGTGAWIHVWGVQLRAPGLHTENSRHRHVDPRPGAYSHVHRGYTRKRADTDTWIHVRGRTATCTGPTHR